MTIIQITESCEATWFDEYGVEQFDTDVEVFTIDTAKITEDIEEHEIRYVKHIIDAAVFGTKTIGTSRKFSFSDTPDWFVSIAADEGAIPERSISVEIC